MTDMILYTTVGSAIGAGALGGAIFLRKKWDTWIEKQVAARCADRMATEEMSIGRLALKTRQALMPDFDDQTQWVKSAILDSEKRIARVIEAALVKNTAESRMAAIKEFSAAAFDPFPKQPMPETPPPAAKSAATWSWSWRSDRAAVAVAGELTDSLVRLKMPKDQAMAQVNACMDRCAKPGCTHDGLFADCFKKA